jgi:DNA-binding transcriptional regulator/RsmH inhibitor MraZ
MARYPRTYRSFLSVKKSRFFYLHPEVKPILEARHEEWKKFQASLSALGRKKNALEPSSRKLTTEAPGFSRDQHSFELEPVGGGR